MNDSLTLTSDPLWPWSVPGYGSWALLLVALLLGALTVWTYLGVAAASARRVFIVLCLRFLALFLAILVLMRPALASRDDLKTPSVLVLLLDRSESMTIHDEYSGLSRWEALQRILEKSEATLQQLRDEHNVNVVIKTFAEDVEDYNALKLADGRRTDFGTALNKLFAEYGQERVLRGLLAVSDGANNGVRFDPLVEAEKWRRRSCPIHTFSLGQTAAPAKQRDISLTDITPAPSPVPVKNKLTVTALIDAPGFENQAVWVRLFIDDKEVEVKQERLTKSAGNEVQLSALAPDKPGEIKVTVKVDVQIGETIQNNNELTTFVTVTKEGLSVLYVEGKYRAYEPKFIKYALTDPRIRLDEMVRPTDGPLSLVPGKNKLSEAEILRFDKQHYDVIIIGDISARRLSGGDPGVLRRIRDEVVQRGAGLMMIGGYETFGNSDWKGTPIADLLPVEVDVGGQVEQPIRMAATKQGLDRYLMRLDDDPKKNKELWENELPKLDQMTRLGKEKLGTVVLARVNDPVAGAPLLVSGEMGNGRTLAFGGDTTEKWRNLGLLEKPPSFRGVELHARFWRQVALWLAKQEEATGNIWVRPDARRLPAGAKQGINVGLRGKSGVDVPGAEFVVKVIDADKKTEHSVTTSREAAGERGVFWKTDHSGEYKIVVRGKGKDTDGQVISGETSARFVVYQDTAELARQAADHEFMARLANTGGGKALRADELPRFLQDLRNQPLPQSQRVRAEMWPDWRRNRLSGFMVAFMLAFVGILGLEWFLRRSWGMV